MAVDPEGVLWVGLSTMDMSKPNLLRFDGQSWSSFKLDPGQNTTSTPIYSVSGLAFDLDGSVWAVIGTTLAHQEHCAWQYYSIPSSMSGGWGALAIDRNGTKWLGLTSFDGSTWRTHRGDGGSFGTQVQIDREGHKWSLDNMSSNGLVVYRDGYDTAVPAGQWLDERTYRAGVEITSLVDRGGKRLEITGAVDSSGMPAAPDDSAAFTVDYAGQVSDRTPPPAPYAFASGVSGDPSRVTIQYAVDDADSAVDMVRYAIGSAAEAGDIVSWTDLQQPANAPGLASLSTVRSIERSSLGLTAGRTYYVSLQARNVGGLWSPPAVSAFVAGEVTNPRGYISALGPAQARMGAGGVSLTIHGYGFMPESLVLWDGQPRETTYVGPNELRASIPASDLATAGKAQVSVRNPAPGGGDGAPFTFTISDGRVGGKFRVSLPLMR
jgi:hypothetical protein